MSRLDRWNHVVTVYPEVLWTDSDGNKMRRPSATGIPAKVFLSPVGVGGGVADDTSSFGDLASVPTVYRMRPTRAAHAALGLLGRASEVEWRGQRWSVTGDPQEYGGSSRTRHVDYLITRR